MRIDYDFGDLEAFLAVKQTGTFQSAALRLGLSQSAVTRRIKKLENALGSELFERTTRAVKPTLAAKRLAPRAEAMLDNAHETTHAMRDESVALAYQKNAIVTVAILPSVAPLILPAAIAAFRAIGNQARIRILDRAANEVAEAVAQGDADFGICSIPMLEPTTTFEPLFDDKIILAMPSHHPLANSDQVQWGDLAAAELIAPSQGTGNRLLIDEALARARLPFGWTYEVGRTTTALQLVAAGIGVALLPQASVSYRAYDNIVTRPINAPEIARPIGMISRIGQTNHPNVTSMMNAIRGILPDTFPPDA